MSRKMIPAEQRGIAKSIRLTPAEWIKLRGLGIKWLKAKLSREKSSTAPKE